MRFFVSAGKALLVGMFAMMAAMSAQAIENPAEWGPWEQPGYVPGAVGDTVGTMDDSSLPSGVLVELNDPIPEIGGTEAASLDPIDIIGGIVEDICEQLGGACDLADVSTVTNIIDTVADQLETTVGDVGDLVEDTGLVDTVEDTACGLLGC